MVQKFLTPGLQNPNFARTTNKENDLIIVPLVPIGLWRINNWQLKIAGREAISLN